MERRPREKPNRNGGPPAVECRQDYRTGQDGRPATDERDETFGVHFS
jgi:hypothetical protein